MEIVPVDDLFDTLASESALMSGWVKVWSNAGSPGGDNISVHSFAARLGPEIARLIEDLQGNHYHPGPLRRVSIPKPKGGFRPLAIPCVRDRVVQSALHLLLEPVFEPHFSDSSFAYRPGRGVQQAIRRIQELHRDGFRHVVDADITRYFENVPHGKLLEHLRLYVTDPRIHRVIASWLNLEPNGRGLPQGSPISPILSNLYLDHLDDSLAGKGVRIVRFADDFVILCRSADIAGDALGKARRLLSSMGLELHPEKTRLVDFNRGFKFLGRMFMKGFVLDTPDNVEDEPYPQIDKPTALPVLPAAPSAPPADDEEVGLADEASTRGDPLPSPHWTPSVRSSQDAHDLSPILRPVYCLGAGRKLGLRGEAFAVFEDDQVLALLAPRRIGRIEIGPDAEIETEAMRHALRWNIPVAFVTQGGRELGALLTRPLHGRVHLEQSRARLDPKKHLAIARALVDARLRNQRALLSRLNRRRKIEAVSEAATRIGRIALKLPLAMNVESMRGIEGEATALYWPALGKMLENGFKLERRERDPPTTAADALFNFAASLLTRDIETLIHRHGLHAGIGFLHAERDREAPLAWDFIEPFRAPLVEGFVVYVINNRVVSLEHMAEMEGKIWSITPDGRDRFVRAYEAWMGRPITNRRDGGESVWRGLIDADILAFKASLSSGEPFAPYVMDY